MTRGYGPRQRGATESACHQPVDVGVEHVIESAGATTGQRERGEHLVPGAGPRRAGDDGDERPGRSTERRQLQEKSGPHARRSSSRRRRSRSGRALVTYGTFSKLCGGGGEVVYHSSVSPSQG